MAKTLDIKDRSKPNYLRQFWICVGLALATTAVYYQVCTYDFVNYDDVFIYGNPNIQAGITLKAIKWAFTTGYFQNWHPLTWLSYMLDVQFFGTDASGYHFTNLVLHIVNTLLLFIILKKMTNAVWPSAFVAALFALHPLHVQPVAWVAGRKDVLSTLFWMLTMAAYLQYVKRPGIGRYTLTLLTFALGLMAKSMLVTIPFVLLLLDYWPLERLSFERAGEKSGKKQRLYKLIIEKIPFIVISIISIIVTYFAQASGGTVATFSGLPMKFRICNAVISYVKYIGKTIWPSRLAFFYPHPGLNVSILYAVISAFILLVITIFVLRFSKNRRYIVTGWFWYLISFIPVLGLIQVGSHAMADRYSYIPLIGLFIIIAWSLSELLEKFPYRKIVLWASSLIVLSALSVCSFIQQGYWKNTITLCEHAIKVTDDNYEAHFILAGIFRGRGRTDEAVQHYKEVVRIKPHYFEAFNGMGLILHNAGKIDEAISCYKKAIEIDPCYVDAYVNLGVALIDKGKYADAISLYNKAFQIAPDSIELHINFGIALTKNGQYEKAVKEYGKILNIEPQNTFVRINLGTTLAESGRLEEAAKEYENVLNIEPQNSVALANLCKIFLHQGKPDEAVREYRKYLKIRPDNPNVLNSLGLLLFQQGKIDEAFKCFTETLRIDPNRPQGHYYLGQILAQRNKIDEAIAHLEDALRLEPNWVEPMNDLAWFLAASEKTKAHNPDRAIELAQRACEITNYTLPQLLDTLATAYAAAGNFGKAVEITEKALELCRSDEQKAVKEELEKRLALYKAGKPYIER